MSRIQKVTIITMIQCQFDYSSKFYTDDIYGSNGKKRNKIGAKFIHPKTSKSKLARK